MRPQLMPEKPTPTPTPTTAGTSTPNSKLRIFEEFFVVGVDRETVANVKIHDVLYMPPTTLLQYPNKPENENWYVIAITA
jgi:hypothetical protein